MAPKESGLRNRKDGKSKVDNAMGKKTQEELAKQAEKEKDPNYVGKISWVERIFLLFVVFCLLLPWFYTPPFVQEMAEELDKLLVGNPSGEPIGAPPPPEVPERDGHAVDDTAASA